MNMDLICSKQKAALKHLAATGNGLVAERALEILNCIDHGVVPPPEAVEWFIKWLRENRGAT
jgi:hypothetical protein